MSSEPVHVLLAEGNADLAYMAAHILGRRGWRVTRAATADEARERVSRSPVDLLVLDGALGRAGRGPAGLDLCREIRESHAREALPILLLVGGDREDDVIAGYQAGANDCLLRPYKPAELVAKAAILIEERRRAAGRARTREIVHRALAGDPLRPEDSGAPFASGFRLRGVLGRGSMGAVFRAVDDATGAEAAVKVLDPSLYSDRNAMQRFLREGTLLRDLRHENIVRVLDVGQWEGFFYFTMEYLSGGSLAEALREGPIPEARARQVLRDGALALRALAAAGVVHRDVKPDNLLVGEGGRVKLADFGLARGHDDTTLTRSGIIYGTPSYMSPEQIQGGEVGPKSDLYSLGATVYALVTGTPPFDGVNTRRVLFKHVFEEAPRADAARPGEVSAAFGEVLARLLRKDPGERYATPDEVLTAVEGLPST